MKTNRFKKFLSQALTAVFFIAAMCSHAFSANITSVSNVSIVPSNPSPGDTVTVSWDYVIDSAYNQPAALVVVSNQCALQNGTPNQMVLVGNGCASGGTQVSGGCNIGNNVPAGTNTASKTVTIPSSLTPGFTYYIAVGMKDYNCYINPGLDVSAQNCASFTVPLPPPYINLTQVAEGSSAAPGGAVLYTIYYDCANTNGVVISDAVPSDMTFLEAYDGGTYGAGTVSWNLGNVTSPVKGTVSFLVQVNGGTTAGSIIHDTASATSSGASGSSSDAPVTVGAALKISKYARPSAVTAGQTITYSITYTNEGYAMSEYVNFDSPTDIAGWTQWGSGTPAANWQVTGGHLEQSQNAQSVNWPSIAKPSPLLHDAMYITDLLIPNANFAQDAVFKFNVIDPNNWYQVVMQSDNNSITLQKSLAGTGSNPPGGNKNYPAGYVVNDTWYSLKVQVAGAEIKMRCWKRGDPEPSYWDVDMIDSSPLLAPGTAGYQANQGAVEADNLKIFTPVPATNIRVWDTLPACVTFVNCDQGCTNTGGKVGWNFAGVQGNTVNTVSFWVTADLCANNTVVTNRASVDSDEPAPPVLSGDATVVVGALDSPTYTCTKTFTVTSTPTPTLPPSFTFSSTSTYTRTATQTPTMTSSVTPTAPGMFTNTPTITLTLSFTGTPSPSCTFTPSPTVTMTLTVTSTRTATPTRTPAPAVIQAAFVPVDPATSVGGYAELKVTLTNAGTAAANMSLREIIPAAAAFEENPADPGGNSGWVYFGGAINRILTAGEMNTLNTGGTLDFYFTVKTADTLASGDTIVFPAVDAAYSDAIYTSTHAYSFEASVKVGDIVVYPNPFNPATAVENKLKFANLPRGTQISIYTLNGEQLVSFAAISAYVKWDGKNSYGYMVAPGVYFYILKYNNGKTTLTGKIFVVKQ